MDPAPENNPSPSNLPAILLEVLKTHFSHNSTQFKFSQITSETKISIQKSEALNPEQIQKKPALYVKRGAIQVNRDVIGDRICSDPKHGRGLTSRLSGTITIYCVARTGGEVDALTGETLDCVLIFQTLISSDYNFISFKVNSIGEVGILEDYKETFVCPIILEYNAELSFFLTPEAHPIKNLLASIKLKNSDVENSFKIK